MRAFSHATVVRACLHPAVRHFAGERGEKKKAAVLTLSSRVQLLHRDICDRAVWVWVRGTTAAQLRERSEHHCPECATNVSSAN
ncbi:hypothetical protein X975_14393, partial [Stegodyphus mimosarum]